ERMRVTLKQNQEAITRSSRMEALGQMAGGVAHDFNNLLTVISGYSELALTKTPPDSEIAASMMQIRMASDRAAGLTRQLLAFSRKQVLQPKVIDLNEILRE